MTFRTAETAQANDPEAGKGVETTSLGLAHIMRLVFKVPGLLLRGLRRMPAHGVVTRRAIIGAMFGCAFGLFVSVSMHDETARGQVRMVAMGALFDPGIGLARAAKARRGRTS